MEDYKKKYEAALEWARSVMQGKTGFVLDEVLEKFPELKESGDEKIRKSIIDLVEKQMPKSENKKWMIAWLEKQDPKKHEEELENAYKCADEVQYRRGYEDAKREFEKQCEQKHTDKVESKFKVGDWIYHEISGNTCHINKIENSLYVSDEGATISLGRQNDWRFWTIQDANDGDILCTKDKNCPFIYDKNRYNNGLAYYYAGINAYGNLTLKNPLNLLYHFGKLREVCPATKEQRNLLFQKMKEDGYEWDAEKKELKKIEQNPINNQFTPEQASVLNKNINKSLEQTCVWSEEDEKEYKWICVRLQEHHMSLEYTERVRKAMSWLNFLKERVQPQPKQEWNEEDKKLIDDTCHLINTLASGYGEKVTEPITLSGTQMIASIKNRLRALVDNRPQNNWKPSDEQMDALNLAIGEANSVDTAAGDEAAEILTSLYEQLKKLREE